MYTSQKNILDIFNVKLPANREQFYEGFIQGVAIAFHGSEVRGHIRGLGLKHVCPRASGASMLAFKGRRGARCASSVQYGGTEIHFQTSAHVAYTNAK